MYKSDIYILEASIDYSCILKEEFKGNWVFIFSTERGTFQLLTSQGVLRYFKSLNTGIQFFMQNCPSAEHLEIELFNEEKEEKWILQRKKT